MLYPEKEAADTKHTVHSGGTYNVPSDRVMTTDTLTGSRGVELRLHKHCDTVVPRRLLFPTTGQRRGNPRSHPAAAIRDPRLLPSANYLVVSDLVKWN